MSGYTRSIRSIERTHQYSPISAVSRYAQYERMRGVEEAGRIDGPKDWDARYAEAAEGAVAWIRLASSATSYLSGLQREIGGRAGIDDDRIVAQSLSELVYHLNEWREIFGKQKQYLRPEVWETLELALRHPATEALAIRRDADGVFRWSASNVPGNGTRHGDAASGHIGDAHSGSRSNVESYFGGVHNGPHGNVQGRRNADSDRGFHWESSGSTVNGDGLYAAASAEKQPVDGPSTFRNEADAEQAALLADKERLRRLLLGADGLLSELKRALSYAEQHQAIDLLRMSFPATYPYALYYGAMQTYWPLPNRGVILNKYI